MSPGAGNVRAQKCNHHQRGKVMATKKGKGVVNASVPKTTRVNARIDDAALRRLRVHCAMTGLTPGEVLSRLCEGLRDWSIPVNLNEKRDRPKSDDQAS